MICICKMYNWYVWTCPPYLLPVHVYIFMQWNAILSVYASIFSSKFGYILWGFFSQRSFYLSTNFREFFKEWHLLQDLKILEIKGQWQIKFKAIGHIYWFIQNGFLRYCTCTEMFYLLKSKIDLAHTKIRMTFCSGGCTGTIWQNIAWYSVK